MNDQVISIIRTLTPALVGALLSYLTVKFGITAPEGLEEQLAALLMFVFTGAYYALVRWLEKKFPKLGWLLGYAKTPEYK